LIQPSLDEFAAMGESANIVPLVMELPGDLDTPIGLYKKLCGDDPYCFLLESVEGGERWARYSYIGRRPQVLLRSLGDRVEIQRSGGREERSGEALQIVEEVLQEYKIAEHRALPDFFGGAVGYFSYDMVRRFEVLPETVRDSLQLPDMHLMIPMDFIVYDHVGQKILLVQYVQLDGRPKHDAYQQGVGRLQALYDEVTAPSLPFSRQRPPAAKPELTSTESRESYGRKVERAKEYIANGDVFQVVVSQRLAADTEVPPFDAYRRLRSINPSPYLFYLDFGEYQLVGASPELLVKVDKGRVATCPIAGTRPRGATAEEDRAFAADLLSDEKELAEHRMLVDLGRNDLGRVAGFGSVEVKNLMHIEAYSHVMHIVTNVEADLSPSCSMYDALRACLPAGTVSGAPKVRAMEIIEELEDEKRCAYAGAVGYFGFNGSMDVCITIRTILFKQGTAYLQAGAGIVADSVPDREYEETLRKASALVEALR